MDTKLKQNREECLDCDKPHRKGSLFCEIHEIGRLGFMLGSAELSLDVLPRFELGFSSVEDAAREKLATAGVGGRGGVRA